jgi:hypothetical protein
MPDVEEEVLAVCHNGAVVRVGAVPFKDGEFRVMAPAHLLAVAEGLADLIDARQPGDEELLHRIFGRGREEGAVRCATRGRQPGFEDLKVWLHPRCGNEERRLHLLEVARVEEGANGLDDPRAGEIGRAERGIIVQPEPGGLLWRCHCMSGLLVEQASACRHPVRGL